ncbi:hypothetical protein V1477_015241 [Vespula maculifrons]|uniref:Uncharacterized protein n=1 Tax=Vespula maculifrons TaxID=7453 RepID=A0ABD2BK64_VESMC
MKFPFVRRQVHIAVLTAFPASNNEKLIMKLWSGDTGFREMTTKSSVRPILIINGSVLLRISTSTHRSSHSTHVVTQRWGFFPTHDANKMDFDSYWFSLALNFDEYISQFSIKLWSGDTGLRETTTKSSVRPITVQSCLEFRRVYIAVLVVRILWKIKLWSRDTGLRETTTTSSVRPITVQSCLEFRRVYIAVLVLLVQSCFEFRRDALQFSHGDTRLREGKTKEGLRLTLTVTSSVVFWTSTRELRKISCIPFLQINLRSGDTRLRGRKTKTVLRPTLTVTSSVVFWTSMRELRKISYIPFLQVLTNSEQNIHLNFSFLQYSINLRSGDTRLREGKTKEGLRPTLTVTSSVVFWTSTRELRKISCIPFLQINLRSGDTRLRGRKTKTVLRPTLTVTSSVVFWTSTRELRKISYIPFLQINLRSGDIRLRGRKTKTVLRPTLTVTSSVVLWTSTRELRKFPGEHSCKYYKIINLRSGDTRLRERETKAGLRPPLTVTSSVVFWTSTRELRKISWRSFQQINLRSGDTRLRERETKAGLRPPLTVTSSVVFWTSTRELRKISWRSFQQINLRSGDTRLRERKTKTGLRPPLTVTSSVVLWTSTRELRKISILYSLFAFRLICEVGMLAYERGKQRRSFDRLLQLLVQLCFGLRRENLEKFRIYHSLFCTINLRSGDARLRERKTKTVLRPTLTVTIFYFALPEDFENLSPQVDLEIFAFPLDFENLSSRMDLEIFALPED